MTSRGINQREWDVSQSFRQAIAKTIELAPELVLIAGDVFHQVRPTNTAIVLAYQQFMKLRQQLPDAEIVMIAGNHDTPRSTDLVCILRLFASIGIRVVEADAKSFDFPELDLELLAVPSSAFERHKLVPSGARQRNILLTHGSVAGERSKYAAPTGAPLLELPDEHVHADEWSYIALGHYHVFNDIRPHEVYAGAIDYTSTNPWSEIFEQGKKKLEGKCIVEYDLDTRALTKHFLAPSRIFIDLEPVSARGRTAEEVNALIDERVESCEGGIDDKVIRLIVFDIPRHVARQLDHRRLREYRQRALNFQLDPRKPELFRNAAYGAPGRRPSLQQLVRDKLRERVVPPDVDRESLVDLGIHYLKEAEERESVANPVIGAVD